MTIDLFAGAGTITIGLMVKQTVVFLTVAGDRQNDFQSVVFK